MIRQTRRAVFGLTLVELMVTLAVLAIIASIGYPMYTKQVHKGRRADARAGVMELAMAQEREFAAWGGYSENNVAMTGIAAGDNDPPPDANSNFIGDLTRIGRQYGKFYSFSIVADNDSFTITATPVSSQTADADCVQFTLDQTGVKAAKGAKDGDAYPDKTDLCW